MFLESLVIYWSSKRNNGNIITFLTWAKYTYIMLYIYTMTQAIMQYNYVDFRLTGNGRPTATRWPGVH